MVDVKIHTRISSIDPETWDSILSPGEIFNTHAFIQVVENARVENAIFWYLMFYHNGKLVGHAVISCFSISLDLFISNNAIVRTIKKMRPDFFKVNLLVCGLPASFGQLNFKVVSPEFDDLVTEALSGEMKKIAALEKVTLLCAKEFRANDVSTCKALINSEFFQAFSIPYMEMDIQWNSFDQYLEQLRHPYRRAIKQSLKKFNTASPVIHQQHAVPETDGPVMVLGDHTLCPPERIFELYLSVMDRTPTKLEVLNLAFFQQFYSSFNSKLELLTIRHHGKVVSTALLIQSQDTMTFMLVGREKEKDDIDSYFNLVYGIIQLCIQRKISKLKMGQTAYWVKQRVGGKPEPVYLYFKSERPFINFVLRKLNRLIFPELLINPIRILHESPTVKDKLLTEALV